MSAMQNRPALQNLKPKTQNLKSPSPHPLSPVPCPLTPDSCPLPPPRRSRRQGVVLLIVVSLLALFILLGVTYTLAVSQYHYASKLEREQSRLGDPPQIETDLVLGQLLYDTPSRTSLWGQSFLADLYGMDGITGAVANVVNANSDILFTNPVIIPTPPATVSTSTGQFVRFPAYALPAADQPYPVAYQNVAPVLSPIPDYYTGRVLTFRDGPYANKSTRITRYEPATVTVNGNSVQGGYIYVDVPALATNTTAVPATGNKFVINGAPFNGAGVGYGDSSNGAGTGPYNMNIYQPPPAQPRVTGQEYYALLPHLAAYSTLPGQVPLSTVAAGGMDESYDAPDYQNMFLAMVPPGRTRNANLPIIPSFHRPELVNYWLNKLDPGMIDTNTNQPNVNLPLLKNFLRQFILRPMPWDHPNFTGSNPNFPTNNVQQLLNSLKGLNLAGTNPIAPWDIDNDNDGIPDSIWIDPGLPVITLPGGRRVKRLAAILVKDLDGRINVNAHGNTQQYANNGYHRTNYAISFTGLAGTTAAASVNVPRGLGLGPAEVDFQHIFGTLANSQGAYINTIFNRYVRATESVPGVNGEDVNTALRWMGLPQDQTQVNFGFTNPAKEWGSPPDLWGRGAMALDLFGQPYWNAVTAATPGVTLPYTSERLDHPYEFQFDYTRASADAPYLPQDMERLLRFHDPDSLALQSRLIDNAFTLLGNYPASNVAGDRPGELGESHYRRELLTTLSSHIPVPPGILQTDYRQTMRVGPRNPAATTLPGPGFNSILDLYYQRLQGNINPNPTLSTFDVVVPFEFRHGELFNINRPIGNGVDDNGNFIADEPLESLIQELAWPASAGPPPRPAGPVVEKLNGYFGTNDPRQEFVRHLYCLMMLLRDPAWAPQIDLDGDGTAGTPADVARLIAQWAVNVIDFRDADSIMTRFQYDPAAFTSGWTTWNPSATVWGVERPELLITETLAFHDRRTEDLGSEGQNPLDLNDKPAKVTDPGPNPPPDTDYDQRFLPQASCFIELYNPWNDTSAATTGTYGAYQRLAPELYNTINGVTGVNLARVSANGSPVWRLLIVKGQANINFQNQNFNPDVPTPNTQLRTNPGDVDRAVYFADPSLPVTNDPTTQAGCITYVSSVGANLSLITGGQHAVVGSSGYQSGNTYTTYVGRQSTDGDIATNGPSAGSRRIILSPGQQRTSGNTSTAEVQVWDNSGPGLNTPTLAARAPIAVPVDTVFGGITPRSFGISDPPGGYPVGSLQPVAAPSIDQVIQPASDVPYDTLYNTNQGNWQPQVDGTFGHFKTVLLQRLADPTQVFDPANNPYITVDRSAIDITAFNGIANDQSDPANQSPQPISFQSFQRGGSNQNTVPWDGPGGFDINRALWHMMPPRQLGYTATQSNIDGASINYFPYYLYNTLGYVNSRYGQPFTAPAAVAGAPQPLLAATPPQTAAFPWLTFNNRPFANPMELLLVPATNQYDLLNRFTIKIGNPNDEYETFAAPFGHLLNFFQSRDTTNPNGRGPQFSRLFDFVHVPSPFIQADSYYNQTYFNSNTPNTINKSVAATFRPPFHKFSHFRDPGRVNINTVFDDSTTTTANVPTNPILQALFKGVPTMDSAMDTVTGGRGSALLSLLRQSRQGYVGTAYTLDTNTNPRPSMFFAPFRAADASDLYPAAPPTTPPVMATFLRPQAATLTATPQSPGLFTNTFGGQNYEYVDAQRNPYFAYQHLQRLGNIASTQSNCFAVWITIGYFEVDPNTVVGINGTAGVNEAHPDGFMLGQEIGADSGQITRHRAFYLIDRSIPVGFIPGSRLNTDDCVLLRRLIE